MGLHNQGRESDNSASRGANAAPNLDEAAAAGAAYADGFARGEQAEFQREQFQRNAAPGNGYAGNTYGMNNILPNLINRAKEVHPTKEIQDFLESARSLSKTGELKDITDFRVHPCSDPKSVYVFRGKDKYGEEVAVLGAFLELIGNEIPRNVVRSNVLLTAAESLRHEEPHLRILAARIYTKQDVETRTSICLNELARTMNELTDRQLGNITIQELLQGDVQFTMQSRNVKAAEDQFKAISPNAVIPPMNACVTIDFRQNLHNPNQGYTQMEPKYDPIIAVALMIDFVEVDRNARWGNSPQFMPRIRITGMECVAPLAGFALWGFICTIDKFVYNFGWMDAFYRGEPLAGDPANLFADQTDPTGNTILSVKPEDSSNFWAQYQHNFGNPIVTLDIEYGRRTIPFLYLFARAAYGSKDAQDQILAATNAFFGPKSSFLASFNQRNDVVCRQFSHTHTGIVSLKNNHIDTRAITYLTAVGGLVGVMPTRDVGLALLQPNRIDATDTDNIMREWLSEDAYVPVFDCYSVALSETYMVAIARAVQEHHLSFMDADNRGKRAMFSGRNPIEGLGFTGQGFGLFNTPNMGYPNTGPTWASDFQ